MKATVRQEEARTTISLRVRRDRRALIDRAAKATGKTRTDFILESATRAAEEALLDQRVFFLDPDAYAAFLEALDTPPEPPAELHALLAQRATWER